MRNSGDSLVKTKNIDNLCAGTPEETKKKKCALADRHTLALSRPGVVLQRGARRLRKRPQRRAAGRPAVAWLVDTPASRDPAYAMVRPALIRRHYSRGDGDGDAM